MGRTHDGVARARAVPIEEVIARHDITLRRSGSERIGPCPKCGGTDRFSINTRKQKFFCRHCRGRGHNAISLVMFLDGCDLSQAVEYLAGVPARQTAHQADNRPNKAGDYERKQHRKAAWLWSQRRPITGTPAETYLRTRCITCALPTTLGFLPPGKPEHHPALIAAFRLAEELELGVLAAPHNVDAVHLTLLRADGSGKADVPKAKLMIGSPGALPIVVAPPNDLLGLAVTEGIEDALTVHQATGLGAWAAGSAGRVPGLADVIPDYIEAVTIYAHADKVGEDSARALATALRARGNIDVVVEGL